MKLDRALAEAELNRLTKKGGGALTAEAVLSAASDSKSPLHPWFDWDDTEAARKWRLEQARRLIKVFYITIEYEPNATVIVPKFVSEADDQGDGRHYVRIIDVMDDDERRRELIVTTIERAASILRNCPEVVCQGLAAHLDTVRASL